MLIIIRSHNYLNGNIFSLVEFLLTAGILFPFTAFYFLHEHYILGTIGLGIIFNCLIIVLIAAISLGNKEKSIGIIKLYSDKEIRRKVLLENPHMSIDTFLLCITIVIPFCLFVFTLYDILVHKDLPKY